MSRNDGQSSNTPENDQILRHSSADLARRSFIDSLGEAESERSLLNFVIV